MYSIGMPQREPPQLSQGVRAVATMIFLIAVIILALYFVHRFGAAAMALGL